MSDRHAAPSPDDAPAAATGSHPHPQAHQPTPRPAFIRTLRADLMATASARAVSPIVATPPPPFTPSPPARQSPAWDVAIATLLLAVLIAGGAVLLRTAGPSAPAPLPTITGHEGSTPPGCAVTPRPVADYVLPTPAEAALLADDPVFQRVRFDAVTSQAALPAGPAATAAEATAVQTFVTQHTACVNAGDYRRIAALMTDEMFVAQILYVAPPPPSGWFEAMWARFPLGDDPRADYSAALLADAHAAPVPLEYPAPVPTVREVRQLADGRLGALLVEAGQPVVFQFLRDVDGELRLDGYIPFIYEINDAGTPLPLE